LGFSFFRSVGTCFSAGLSGFFSAMTTPFTNLLPVLDQSKCSLTMAPPHL
jgi:hypothetical protein